MYMKTQTNRGYEFERTMAAVHRKPGGREAGTQNSYI